MRLLLFFLPINLLFSCEQDEPKFLRKQIDNKDITIKWYYYSYITNESPDFVVVEKGGKKREIYKATGVILNVTLKDPNNIVLRLVEPSKNLVFTRKVANEVFGYKITLDTTGTYDELLRLPEGVKQN